MLLPFASTRPSNVKNEKFTALAGDIGATKTNLAIYQWMDGGIARIRESTFISKDYQGILEILKIFMDGLSGPDAVCLAVAGPILGDKAILTNLHWEVRRQEISGFFGTENIYLINDLEANAYGLSMLDEKEISVIHSVSTVSPGNAAIIAPGTGLGEAGIYWDGIHYHPFATEGGHSDFAVRNETEFALLYYLQKKFGHVSWERLVCGPGIMNIYHFLKEEKKMEEPKWLKEKIGTADQASIISEHADTSHLCDETMKYFFLFFARESANLVLKIKATGGLFIGGGIAPKLVPLFTKYHFFSTFCDSGRMNFLLEKVPIHIILNNKAALLGAAYFAHEKHSSS